MNNLAIVAAKETAVWLTTQLAAAKTSQYGIVRVLAAGCTVNGLAIAVLVAVAIGCFYKANENWKLHQVNKWLSKDFDDIDSCVRTGICAMIEVGVGSCALLGAALICGSETVMLVAAVAVPLIMVGSVAYMYVTA